ncbi:Wzz/FepE/Etk N-terminal domain-containing protein [Malaciobacter marinus]|uniref:Wzz/FepE/Etk N-terminal domain-containing protein n=1 Tax=Malaciobacter marinus TaxID=505249 RepID=UPI003B00345F
MNNQNENNYNKHIIDLEKIFIILKKNINFIFLVVFFIVFLAFVYIFIKKPIYEVESTLQVGRISNERIERPEILAQNAQIYFKYSDNELNRDVFVSKLSYIKPMDVIDFITIKTQAYSNEEALSKNNEVIKYIKSISENKIKEYKRNINYKINTIKEEIFRLNTYQKKDLQSKISNLKDLMKNENIKYKSILSKDFTEIDDKNIKYIILNNLEYKLNIEVPNKINELKIEIDKLKSLLSDNNIINTKQVGDYLILNSPIKPRKILIILISILSGLLIALFFVYFKEVIKKDKGKF